MDKPIPGNPNRKYLDIFEFNKEGPLTSLLGQQPSESISKCTPQLFFNPNWLQVLKLTDNLMPFDNSYYNDLSTKMRNLEIKEQTIEPIEIVFDEELFLKSKGTPINYYTQDIC